MRARILILALIAGGALSTAGAMEVKDVVKLSKLQLDAEVIIAQIKAKKARFSLTTDQIVSLKKQGVSDRVIKHMIETGAKTSAKTNAKVEPAKTTKPKASAAKTEKKPAAEKTPPVAKTETAKKTATEKKPADGKGTLTLENLDSRDYSIQFDAKNKRIFYWNGSEALGRSKMPADTSMIYRVAPGTYKLRWVGEIPVYSVRVVAGKGSRASLTRTEKDGVETVSLSVYEDGARRGGGRLVILADSPPAESTQTSAPATPAVVEKHYYHSTPQPATTYVVTRHPQHCYSNYCSRGYYHAGCPFHSRYRRYRRNHTPTIGFIYGWKRGKSRYAIGINSYGDVGFSYGRKVGRGRYAIGIGW
jgi:hypothetical protein